MTNCWNSCARGNLTGWNSPANGKMRIKSGGPSAPLPTTSPDMASRALSLLEWTMTGKPAGLPITDLLLQRLGEFKANGRISSLAVSDGRQEDAGRGGSRRGDNSSASASAGPIQGRLLGASRPPAKPGDTRGRNPPRRGREGNQPFDCSALSVRRDSGRVGIWETSAIICVAPFRRNAGGKHARRGASVASHQLPDPRATIHLQACCALPMTAIGESRARMSNFCATPERKCPAAPRTSAKSAEPYSAN